MTFYFIKEERIGFTGLFTMLDKIKAMFLDDESHYKKTEEWKAIFNKTLFYLILL